jgi:hypothetical protein
MQTQIAAVTKPTLMGVRIAFPRLISAPVERLDLCKDSRSGE